jgi:hypothetical protein
MGAGHKPMMWAASKSKKTDSHLKSSKETQAGCQWLKPVILTTQEAEIRRIIVRSQPRQIVHETLS